MYLYVTCCIYAHPYFQNFGNDTKEIHLFWRGPAPFQYKVTQAKSSKANWIFLAVLHDSPKYQKKIPDVKVYLASNIIWSSVQF